MKVVERYLYSRNGSFYFRTGIPLNLRPIIGRKEYVVALGTKDLGEARIQAVQLNYELVRVIKGFKQELHRLPPEQSLEPLVDKLVVQIDGLKGSLTYRIPEWFKQERRIQQLLFSNVVEKYMEDCPADSHSTREHKESTYDLFKEVIGDLPFKTIGIEEGRLFKTRLLKMPANAKRVWRVDDFTNVDWGKLVTNKPQHPRTINNRLSYMSVLFNWAIKAGYYHNQNPFKGLLIPKSQKVVSSRCHPFKPEELKTLFQSPLCMNSHQISMRWVPLTGLYSGMRLNEICQLYVADIRQKDGVYIFDVNDDGDDKALKTSSSRRIIPIHKQLIKYGLLDYWGEMQKTGTLRLFPDIPRGQAAKNYSSTFTKRFWRLLLELQIKRQGLCFHSFRHTFVDGMRNAGVERSIIMALTGHQSSKGVHDDYGYGYNLAILQDRINKLSFSIEDNKCGMPFLKQDSLVS